MFNAVLLLILSLVSSLNTYNYELPEGSPCIKIYTVQVERKIQVEGKCVNMFRCPEVIADRIHGKEPTICSFDGLVPIVCCGSCELVRNITDAVITVTGQLYWKTGSKAWDHCIQRSSELPYKCQKQLGLSYGFPNCSTLSQFAPAVAYGRNALRLEFPHMALLGYGEAPEEVQWLCGGSILSERFVLTAAHCTSYSRAAVSRVAAGILRRSDEAADGRQMRLVARVVPHPDYRSPDKYHDIALLQTDKPFEFNKFVLPACLPAPILDTERIEERSEILATGWGALGARMNLAEVLQVVSLEEQSQSQCKSAYPKHRLLNRGFDHNTQMCFGDLGTSTPGDTCEGDSGGPLQYFSSSTCAHVVVGVTSYGRPCGFPGGAGIYTRVHHYIPWIESIVWP